MRGAGASDRRAARGGGFSSSFGAAHQQLPEEDDQGNKTPPSTTTRGGEWTVTASEEETRRDYSDRGRGRARDWQARPRHTDPSSMSETTTPPAIGDSRGGGRESGRGGGRGSASLSHSEEQVAETTATVSSNKRSIGDVRREISHAGNWEGEEYARRVDRSSSRNATATTSTSVDIVNNRRVEKKEKFDDTADDPGSILLKKVKTTLRSKEQVDLRELADDCEKLIANYPRKAASIDAVFPIWRIHYDAIKKFEKKLNEHFISALREYEGNILQREEEEQSKSDEEDSSGSEDDNKEAVGTSTSTTTTALQRQLLQTQDDFKGNVTLARSTMDRLRNQISRFGNTDHGKILLYRVLIYKGDLERYFETNEHLATCNVTHELQHASSRKKQGEAYDHGTWAPKKVLYKGAIKFYREANALYPDRGQSFNQLALIFQTKEDEDYLASYYYMRAFTALGKPFDKAQGNLSSLLISANKPYSRRSSPDGGEEPSIPGGDYQSLMAELELHLDPLRIATAFHYPEFSKIFLWLCWQITSRGGCSPRGGCTTTTNSGADKIRDERASLDTITKLIREHLLPHIHGHLRSKMLPPDEEFCVSLVVFCVYLIRTTSSVEGQISVRWKAAVILFEEVVLLLCQVALEEARIDSSSSSSKRRKDAQVEAEVLSGLVVAAGWIVNEEFIIFSASTAAETNTRRFPKEFTSGVWAGVDLAATADYLKLKKDSKAARKRESDALDEYYLPEELSCEGCFCLYPRANITQEGEEEKRESRVRPPSGFLCDLHGEGATVNRRTKAGSQVSWEELNSRRRVKLCTWMLQHPDLFPITQYYDCSGTDNEKRKEQVLVVDDRRIPPSMQQEERERRKEVEDGHVEEKHATEEKEEVDRNLRVEEENDVIEVDLGEVEEQGGGSDEDEEDEEEVVFSYRGGF